MVKTASLDASSVRISLVSQKSQTPLSNQTTESNQCVVPSEALYPQLAGPRRGALPGGPVPAACWATERGAARHQRDSISSSPSVPARPPPSLLSPSLLQCLPATFLDNYIFGNGPSACCGANCRVNGLFPSTISS